MCDTEREREREGERDPHPHKAVAQGRHVSCALTVHVRFWVVHRTLHLIGRDGGREGGHRERERGAEDFG